MITSSSTVPHASLLICGVFTVLLLIGRTALQNERGGSFLDVNTVFSTRYWHIIFDRVPRQSFDLWRFHGATPNMAHDGPNMAQWVSFGRDYPVFDSL